MAGDWIPVTVHLDRRREVLAIAEATKRDRFQVVGLLVAFWGWVTEESRFCHVSTVTSSALTAAIGGDEAFWLAVEKVGWIRFTDDGLEIPNWDRWNGRTAKERLLNTLRQREVRKSKVGCHGDVTLMSRSHRDKCVTRPRPQMTDDNNTSSPPTPSSEGGVCGTDKTDGTDPETAVAWDVVLHALPRRDPSVKRPGGYVASLQKKFDHPREAGIKWFEEEWQAHERQRLIEAIAKRSGQSFVDVQGTRWQVSAGSETEAAAVVDCTGKAHRLCLMKTPELARIASRLLVSFIA